MHFSRSRGWQSDNRAIITLLIQRLQRRLPSRLHGRDAAVQPDEPSHRARAIVRCHVPHWALQLFGSPALLLRRAGRAPGGYCRCTRNRGATVHLLEGPITAHLHRHDNFFIDTTKYSASTRPSRRGVPRGGTRQDRRGISISPRGATSPHQGQLRKLHHQGTSSRQGGDVACSPPSGPPPPEGRRV